VATRKLRSVLATPAASLLMRSYASSANPPDRKYTKTHEWIKVDNGIGTVGITAHAAGALGDVVYAELPAIGTAFAAGDSFGAVESVKAASDVYMPVAGTVTEINAALEDTPDLINASPWEKGWMTKIKIKDEAQLGSLLTNDQYEANLDKEDH